MEDQKPCYVLCKLKDNMNGKETNLHLLHTVQHKKNMKINNVNLIVNFTLMLKFLIAFI